MSRMKIASGDEFHHDHHGHIKVSKIYEAYPAWSTKQNAPINDDGRVYVRFGRDWDDESLIGPGFDQPVDTFEDSVRRK